MSQHWYCNACGSKYVSPIKVEKVWHRCLNRKRRQMTLVTESETTDTPDGD